jgi:phosphate transport system permease protein
MSQETLPPTTNPKSLPEIGPLEKAADKAFRGLTWVTGWLSAGLVLLIVVFIAVSAWPAMQRFGGSFLVGTSWETDPGHERFGILPEIWGTLFSSILALILATFFGVAVAIFLSEDFLPPRMENALKNMVELLAAIPSVIYGLWGIYVVIPTIRPFCNWIHDYLGWIPLFGTPLSGPGMLPAALVLAIMILPTISALSRAAIINVPQRLRDGAVGLGATRWETILKIVLPSAATGILGSVILAFGRALGETMALAMLVGNRNVISWSLLSPGDTLAALLANSFAEASGIEVGALMFASLVLLSITLLVNIVGSLVIWRATAGLKGLR